MILAVYYTLADMVLLGQCFYYRGLTWRDEPSSGPKPAVREPDERCALLPDEPRADWAGLSPIVTHASEDPEPQAPPRAVRAATWNAAMVAMVCAAGVLGWFLGEAATGGRRKPSGGTDSDGLELNALGQLFGYLCAVAYVASRLPQLMLNWRRKTTEGLSMLFFLFACFGNVTYVLSIVAYDARCGGGTCAPGEAGHIYGRYLLVNLSWLAGSLVTLLMDLAVFAQYFAYRAEGGRPDGQGPGEDGWDRPLLDRHDASH